MRKLYSMLTIIGLAILSLFAVSPAAQAATDISEGSSCKLSANWTVNVSINFDNTSSWTGFYWKGKVDYVVMSSPGPLNVSGSSGSEARFYVTTNGGQLEAGSPRRGFNLQSTGSGPYIYRADFGGSAGIANTYISYINPKSNTGVFCSSYDGSDAYVQTPAG